MPRSSSATRSTPRSAARSAHCRSAPTPRATVSPSSTRIGTKPGWRRRSGPRSSPTCSWWMRRMAACARVSGMRSAIVFVETGWPAPLASWRPEFERQLANFADERFGRRGTFPGFPDDETLLVAPLRSFGPPPPGEPNRPPPVFGYTVVQLNREFMVGNVLPELSRRFFIHSEGDSYRVAVVQTNEPDRVIYQSDPAMPVHPDSADATETFFGPRGPAFFFGRRGGGGGGGGGRDRGGPRFPAPPPPPDPTAGPPGPPPNLDRWLVAVQHASGSLEAAVGQRAPAQSGDQLRRPAAALDQRGAAGPGLAARAAAGAPADGVRGRRLARAAHADRGDPLGRREPVAWRRRRERPRQAVRPGDGRRGTPPRGNGGKRPAVRGRRVGAGSRTADADRAGRRDRAGG